MRLTPVERLVIASARALPAPPDLAATARDCADRIRLRLDDSISDEDAAVIAIIIATAASHIATHFPGDPALPAAFVGYLAAEFADPGGNPGNPQEGIT